MNIFRDTELEAANDILRGGPSTEELVVIVPPTDALPEGLRHDAHGTPSFENRPTTAQLVEQINRTQGAQHDAAREHAEREREARRNRGLAYQTAAMCLATTQHDLTAAQTIEMDRLAKQMYRTGTRLLKGR